MAKKVFIVLPMYNEQESIKDLKDMFSRNFKLPDNWKYEIIVVDDGSDDDTAKLVENWKRRQKNIRVVTHSENRGLGQAVITGFKEAIRSGGDCIITMDADATHSEKVIHSMVNKIDEGNDIVIASRFVRGGWQAGLPIYRMIFSFVAKLVYKVMFPIKGVNDYTINFRAYKSSIVKEALELNSGGLLRSKSFSAAVEIMLKLASLSKKIKEVPVVVDYSRKKSKSKLKFFRTVKESLKLGFLPKHRCSVGKCLKIV